MTDTNQELRDEARRLREQLLGVQLLALELKDEVETVRHHVNSVGPSQSETVDAVHALARIDALLEPLLTARQT